MVEEAIIRVLIADDHPIMRKGLCVTLEEDPGVKVVGEAANGLTALELVKRLKPDIAILDIDMPGLDGFSVARELLKTSLDTHILFLTLHAEEDMFRAAMEIGAKGYLLKDSAMMEIGVGVRAVAAGQMFVSAAITTQMLRKPVAAVPAQPSVLRDLTPTECRILRLIAEGKSSKDIGPELSIHYRTVENHRTNICRKLGIDGTNALLRFALKNKNAL